MDTMNFTKVNLNFHHPITLIDNYASFEREYYCADGSHHVPLHWFELAKEHWTQVYRSTGTPCSCWMCRGNEYSRLDYKRETHRIIQESMD